MSYDKALDMMYKGYREFDLERDLMPQLNIMDVLATSGGRRAQLNKYEAKFPVARGYSVRVRLSFMDTWEVTRVFEREGKAFIKETWSDVYADEVSRALYEASCYHHTKEDLVSRR
jgi:hypothetical protein